MYGTIARSRPKGGDTAALRALLDEWNQQRRPEVPGAHEGYLFMPDAPGPIAFLRRRQRRSSEESPTKIAWLGAPAVPCSLFYGCHKKSTAPAALVHGNRGRPSSRRLAEPVRTHIIELARTRYDGANDSHLAELLAERDGIHISRASLQRLLRAAGVASPRRRRPARHRSRRDRMPQEGLLLQTDGSRHDWLEGRGPGLTLVGAIADATGRMTAATFRDQEGRRRLPHRVARDRPPPRHPGGPLPGRHTLFETPKGSLQTLEEQLADTRTPTQLGRALAELGITSIAARSPLQILMGHESLATTAH